MIVEGAPLTDARMPSPSPHSILSATAIAFLAAVTILFVAVLPAEYGIDPLRTGKILGLTGISQASAVTPVAGKAIPAAAGIYTPQPAIFKTDSEDLALEPGEGVEIIYHMQKGAEMLYAWKADARVAFEFHGEPDKKPNKDYYESYQLDDKVGQDHANGSFTAPTTGIHGWFWQNKGKKEVMIHLVTAGFYDSAKMFSGSPAGDDLTIQDAK